jgi:hypothetical protein
MKSLIQISLCLVLSSCTISVTTIHTQGVASDVVDEDQKADADVSPDISLPAFVKSNIGGRETGSTNLT